MSAELKGIPAAPGLARGASLLWESPPAQIPTFIPADSRLEKQRLLETLALAARQLREMVGQISGQVGADHAAVFEAQAMFLEDPALVHRAESLVDSGLNAGQAWHLACDFYATQLEHLPDELLSARAADVRDISGRVLDILAGRQSRLEIPRPAVILARDLAPSQTAILDTSKVLAFCTAEGGPTSHTSILARALGIPAVVGLGEDVLAIADGTLLLVDGTDGRLILDPASHVEEAFMQRLQTGDATRRRDLEQASEYARTQDGHRVEMVANVGNVEDARTAMEYGAEGIGLLRTEFLFLNRPLPPDEQTQYEAYHAILEIMGSRPVVARTLDVGGDKEVPFLNFGPEPNPFLGYRAIRISLDHPGEFKTQLRALLRAGHGHDLRIMFPMISSTQEVLAAKSLLDEARQDLRLADEPFADKVQVGIMVEVPSVVFLADRFARIVDFFSIGTNDLTQYTLAAERGNKRLSRLSDPCHPAVLKEIQLTVAAAHNAGIWVGVCGEMAGDPQAIPILLGLGVNELSMSPRQVPAAKQIIRVWSLKDAQAMTLRALEEEDAAGVRNLVSKFKA